MRSFFRFLCGVLASLALPGSSLALSLDEAFAQLKFYDAGQSNTALVFIDHYVARVSADATQRRELATRLAALLADTGASEPAKLFVCQQLRVVASDTQVPQVAAMLDDAKTADLARLVLQPMPGPAASRALLEALGRVQGEPLIGVINSIGDRQDAGAVQPLGGFLGNTNPKVAAAAAHALGKIGTVEASFLLANAQPPFGLRSAFLDAQLVCAQRLAASGAKAQAAAIYRPLFAAGQPIKVRLAALSGLVAAVGNDALPQFLEAMNSTDPLLRKVAIQLSSSLAIRESAAALKQILATAQGEMRLLVLGALAEQGDAVALAELSKEAGSSEQGVRTGAAPELRRLTWAVKDKAILEQLAASAGEPEAMVEVLSPAPYADLVAVARRREIEGKLAQGDKLLTYLDCGAAAVAQSDDVTLRQANGGSWYYPGSEKVAAPTFGSVAFNGGSLDFEIAGLKPQKHYAVGFSWWDYDNNGRIQSAQLAGGQPLKRIEVLPPTKLPAYSGANVGPAFGSLPIEPALAANGRIRVTFPRRTGPNATVSELWLIETQAGSPAATKAAISSGASVAAVDPAPTPPVDLTPPVGGTRILIVTGDDYPGHKWKETAPVIKRLLEQDAHLKVGIVEDPAALASPRLKEWDVVLLHFQNWEKPGPGDAARTNLQKYIANGGGLVSVHFACGAWHGEWPEFQNILGRVWHGSGPGKPQHDAYGQFVVEIADKDHPITRGLLDFETTDELYTCLTGDAPIHLLAHSKSKVDQKYHPQAFVRDYGKGRVFLTTLGHDVRAWTNSPSVGELLRRGCAWTAESSAGSAPTR